MCARSFTPLACLRILSTLIFNQATLYSALCSYIILLLLVYPDAGSPNVTSLTFDDQSMTLTCISTGGPATTVTWRRDGVVITLNATYQQTKSLVDSVAGTYQTVLTIDPSVDLWNIVGAYNCTVENDKGESWTGHQKLNWLHWANLHLDTQAKAK